MFWAVRVWIFFVRMGAEVGKMLLHIKHRNRMPDKSGDPGAEAPKTKNCDFSSICSIGFSDCAFIGSGVLTPGSPDLSGMHSLSEGRSWPKKDRLYFTLGRKSVVGLISLTNAASNFAELSRSA